MSGYAEDYGAGAAGNHTGESQIAQNGTIGTVDNSGFEKHANYE